MMTAAEIELTLEDDDTLAYVKAIVTIDVAEDFATWETPAIEERNVASVCVTEVTEVTETHRRVLDRRESPMEALGTYEERVMLAIHESPELIG